MNGLPDVTQKEVRAFGQVLKCFDGLFFLVEVDMGFAVFAGFDMCVTDNDAVLASEGFDNIDVVRIKSVSQSLLGCADQDKNKNCRRRKTFERELKQTVRRDGQV